MVPLPRLGGRSGLIYPSGKGIPPAPTRTWRQHQPLPSHQPVPPSATVACAASGSTARAVSAAAARPTRARTRCRRAGWSAAGRVSRWWLMDGAWGKGDPSRAAGGTGPGRPAGGPGDRAGLPRCADAARWRPAVAAGAPARGSPSRSTPGPGSRTRRWRTPRRTPPRGTGACATLRRGPSPRPGCRGRLVRGCRWHGGRAALSGRATARGRGVRMAGPAPAPVRTDTRGSRDGLVSRS